ncbi:hypothetical protein BJ742DRAFT_737753 [Cladochytrium replicatum]|nr:hypothetical protein BJ742DRAFT_737753 [Cladochytrium replicatum]
MIFTGQVTFADSNRLSSPAMLSAVLAFVSFAAVVSAGGNSQPGNFINGTYGTLKSWRFSQKMHSKVTAIKETFMEELVESQKKVKQTWNGDDDDFTLEVIGSGVGKAGRKKKDSDEDSEQENGDSVDEEVQPAKISRGFEFDLSPKIDICKTKKTRRATIRKITKQIDRIRNTAAINLDDGEIEESKPD